MLASFQQHLPTITAEVQASVERARNSPPPAPPDPDGRRFWRVRADWGADTDGDGIPDWIEWRGMAWQAANPGAMTPGSPSYDPANPDTNDYGVPDGYQLDSDADGVMDSLDHAPGDGIIDTNDPVWRFAAFDLPEVVFGGGPCPPRHANDQGIVLYPDRWWQAGTMTGLITDTPGQVEQCHAMAMNAAGNIIGIGQALRQPNGTQPVIPPPGSPAPAVAPLPLVWAWWETPQSAPVPVEADGVFAEPTEAALSAMSGPIPPGTEPFPYDSLLADNGRFVGRHMDDPLEPPQTWRMIRSEWRRQGTGFTRTSLPEAGGMFSPEFATGENFVWGPWTAGRSLLWNGGASHELDGAVRRLPEMIVARTADTATPERYHIACRDSGIPMSDRNGAWTPAPALADTCAASANTGVRVLRVRTNAMYPPGPGTPATGVQVLDLAQGARRRPLADWTPDWDDLSTESYHERSMTPNGWLLTSRESGDRLHLPVLAQDPADASGVDAFSLTGQPWEPGVDGAQKKAWIMLPLGGGEDNVFRLLSKASGEVPLVVSSEGGVLLKRQVESGDTWRAALTVTWPYDHLLVKSGAALASGGEINLKFALDNGSGPVESLSHPLALKAMKPRLVKVALHRVTFEKPDGPSYPPDIELAAADLQTHLNAVFRPQINATFEVAAGTAFALDWNAGAGDSFLFGNDGITLSEAQSAIANHGEVVTEANIKVFLMGAHYYLGPPGGAAAGVFTRIDPDGQGTHNACWIHATNMIKGHPSNNPRGAEHLKWTIAHEIGHVLLGAGHPGEAIGGPAPLPGTDHRQRLMAGGALVPLGAIRSGKLLVKAEWDEAEAWLEANIKDEEE